MSMSATACTEPAVGADNAPPPTQRSWWRLAIWIGLASGLIWLLWKVYYILVTGNVHEVLPGKLYRGAQPSGTALERIITRYKIRTVINARGCCYPDPWYVTEAGVCQAKGVHLEDVSFSAVHLPSRHELKVVIDVLDHAEYPIFVHCRQGADRSGLTAVIACLLEPGVPLETARGQFSILYGHAPIGRTTMLDRFVQLYVDWLAAKQVPHTPERFRDWALNEYNGAWCDARFEKVERLFDVPRTGMALEYDVTVRNTSTKPWQFRTLRTAGFHVCFKVTDYAQAPFFEGRAGMLDRVVAPGETINVTLTVPPLQKPGLYRLYVDMVEEGHCWFHQSGSGVHEEELMLRE